MELWFYPAEGNRELEGGAVSGSVGQRHALSKEMRADRFVGVDSGDQFLQLTDTLQVHVFEDPSVYCDFQFRIPELARYALRHRMILQWRKAAETDPVIRVVLPIPGVPPVRSPGHS